jgi:hypothetical protein
MNKSQTISVIAITIFAAILLVGPVADDANAHNKKHKESSKNKDGKDGKEEKKEYSKDQKEEEGNKNNEASQKTSQAQFSEQFSQCISGGVTALSCNNVDLQAAATVGNNAIGQQ